MPLLLWGVLLVLTLLLLADLCRPPRAAAADAVPPLRGLLNFLGVDARK